MTGDIRAKLATSDAVASLQMEARVASAFEKSQWNVDRSAYYTDLETGKIREIDIYASHIFQKPVKRKGVGQPTMNIDVLCECKNLSGSNVIFAASDPSRLDMLMNIRNRMELHWIGQDQNLRDVAVEIAKSDDGILKPQASAKDIYDYILKRAYAHTNSVMWYPASMPPPPVDAISTSFRETKGGELPDTETTDGSKLKKNNPVWNSIQSVLSSARAVEQQRRNNSLQWIDPKKLLTHGIENFASDFSFSLDVELCRFVFIHQFVVTKSKLWKLQDHEIISIDSARLYIKNVSKNVTYVDVVSEDSVETYVNNLNTCFAKNSRYWISRVWQSMDAVGWYPGQLHDELCNILKMTPTDNAIVRVAETDTNEL